MGALVVVGHRLPAANMLPGIVQRHLDLVVSPLLPVVGAGGAGNQAHLGGGVQQWLELSELFGS